LVTAPLDIDDVGVFELCLCENHKGWQLGQGRARSPLGSQLDPPEEILVDPALLDQVLELLEPGVLAALEDLAGHADPLEDFEQLLGAHTGGVLRAKAGQLGLDLVERDLIAAVVAVAAAKADLAAREDLADDIGDIAHLIVLAGGADIEDLAVDG